MKELRAVLEHYLNYIIHLGRITHGFVVFFLVGVRIGKRGNKSRIKIWKIYTKQKRMLLKTGGDAKMEFYAFSVVSTL